MWTTTQINRWVLYHVTRGGTDRIDAVLSVGLLSRLPDFLLHESPEVRVVSELVAVKFSCEVDEIFLHVGVKGLMVSEIQLLGVLSVARSPSALSVSCDFFLQGGDTSVADDG